MLDMLARTPLKADNVESITVSTSRRNATILRNSRPQTGLEAKFSMQFAMAGAVVAGRVGLGELTDEFVQRRDVQSLMTKVTVEPDDREDPRRSGDAPYDQVVIGTRDGRRIESAKVTDARGAPHTAAVDRGAVGQVRELFVGGQPRAAGPGDVRRADAHRGAAGRGCPARRVKLSAG